VPVRVGRDTRHPAAADVYRRLEAYGVDADVGPPPWLAGGFKGATTTRSGRRRREQHGIGSTLGEGPYAAGSSGPPGTT